jgi:hypothetical protein
MPNERNAIWIAILRQFNGDIVASGVMSLREAFESAHHLDLRMRYANDMRLVTFRLPAGTKREQVFTALDLLSKDERYKLYHLPKHEMGNNSSA